MASIVLSSASFSNGDLIDPIFKSTHCAAPNLSPEFHWILAGIVPAHVEYFELIVEDIAVAGSSPSGCFLHWGAHIPVGIQQIPENGAWGIGVTVSPTDWGSGDKANGWNGPCAPSLHNYRCIVFAKIYDAYASYVWPEGKIPRDKKLMSNALMFIDTPSNIYADPQNFCGSVICPPGYSLNPEQECEMVIQAAAVGAECPDGFLYNPVSGYCEKTVTELPEVIECSWEVQNCQNPTQILYIQMDPNETDPVYVNDVYHFGGNPVFVNTCYRVIGQVENQVPNYDHITIVSNYGSDGCLICEVAEKFERCSKPGEYIYVSLLQYHNLVRDQIYKLSGLDGCYRYKEQISGVEPQYTVTVTVDYKNKECLVCDSCYQFTDCVTGTVVNVTLEGKVFPTEEDLGNVYALTGASQFTNRCWIFTGFVSCIGAIRSEIATEYGCSNCAACLPAYLLTNCADPNDVYRIGWSKLSPPLVDGTAYIFDFLGDECYTAQPLVRNCDSEFYQLYSSSNITDSFSDCTTCNQACYKITDCIDPQEVYWINQDLAPYVDHIVQWTDGTDTKCGLVESYTCRLESYPEPRSFELLDCFDTCVQCYPPTPVEEEFSITHRAVSPGRQVPPCDTTSTINCECDE
jgi:phosphatidylethanolamine-binding protein (PEBP) family uncharacterized protein